MVSSPNKAVVNEVTGLGDAREGAVRAELQRLLESPEFRASKRCSEFLTYVVEHTISGPAGALKERLIGVEVFQLPPDFDPGQHSAVRVTANEVRKKLAQRYQAENGSYHPVRIELPTGSYTAEFKWQRPGEQARIVPPPRQRDWRLVACAAAILVAAGGFLAWRLRAPRPAVSNAGSGSGAAASAVTLDSEEVRIAAGSSTPYNDRSGRRWEADRYFTGGAAVVHPSEKIFRTPDPDIYRRMRLGGFRYDIPLKPGSYELHLHFAETGLAGLISAESGGEGERFFRISANGKTILDQFDVVADSAGSNIADERVFKDISPAQDGLLHLEFATQRGPAILSGIEALPVGPGRVRPVRIRSGWQASWQDPEGNRWQPDAYFMGGNALARDVPPDMALYGGERWGHFSYAVPVPEGRYRVTLRFREGRYGKGVGGAGGIGSRVFDVNCNGVSLLKNFDIIREAGGEGRPLERTFSGIRPTAQGKILLSFVPVIGMACVNGIEVVEELN